MFLKFLKDFLLKRTLKKTLSNVKNDFSSERIKTVGILIDVSYFNDTDAIISALEQQVINRENIQILLYKDAVKKTESFSFPVFSLKDLTWGGIIENPLAIGFLSQDFDLLISYYDIEKAPLLLATQQSRAQFKVGFATVDKRLNHFMINTVAESHLIFLEELFRYLKILNKI